VVDSVLLEDVVVEQGARVCTSVVDEGCVIGRDAVVGATPDGDDLEDEDVTLVGRDSTIGHGAVIEAGARLEPGTTA
jgi:glucose-1-phosphate adenylyltransferase